MCEKACVLSLYNHESTTKRVAVVGALASGKDTARKVDLYLTSQP